jgi:hypothetical protein
LSAVDVVVIATMGSRRYGPEHAVSISIVIAAVNAGRGRFA